MGYQGDYQREKDNIRALGGHAADTRTAGGRAAYNEHVMAKGMEGTSWNSLDTAIVKWFFLTGMATALFPLTLASLFSAGLLRILRFDEIHSQVRYWRAFRAFFLANLAFVCVCLLSFLAIAAVGAVALSGAPGFVAATFDFAYMAATKVLLWTVGAQGGYTSVVPDLHSLPVKLAAAFALSVGFGLLPVLAAALVIEKKDLIATTVGSDFAKAVRIALKVLVPTSILMVIFALLVFRSMQT